MEGVEESARHSDYALELTAHIGTEFLEFDTLSQGTGGADGNFTQPLSPSIYPAAAGVRAATENTAGMNSRLSPC
jgi:hypothetical protein